MSSAVEGSSRASGTAAERTWAGRQPVSVRRARLAAWMLVLVGAVGVGLMALLHDAVLRSWANRHVLARAAYERGGLTELERSGIHPPAFLPVGLVMLGVVGLLVWVLLVFLREGHRWAQLTLTGLAVFALMASLIVAFWLHPPVAFVVVAIAAIACELSLLTLLWHRDTLAWLRGPWRDGPA